MYSFANLEKGKVLSSLCTFGIGGKARFYIKVCSISEMQKAIVFAKRRDRKLFKKYISLYGILAIWVEPEID